MVVQVTFAYTISAARMKYLVRCCPVYPFLELVYPTSESACTHLVYIIGGVTPGTAR